MNTQNLLVKADQVVEFLKNNEGKLATVEFENKFNFFMVSLNELHIQTETVKTILLSDKKDSPDLLTKAKFLIINIDTVEEESNELLIKYNDESKVLVSVY